MEEELWFEVLAYDWSNGLRHQADIINHIDQKWKQFCQLQFIKQFCEK